MFPLKRISCVTLLVKSSSPRTFLNVTRYQADDMNASTSDLRPWASAEKNAGVRGGGGRGGGAMLS